MINPFIIHMYEARIPLLDLIVIIIKLNLYFLLLNQIYLK